MVRSLVILAVLACSALHSCRTVPPGYRGILVYMRGGENGRSEKELNTGRYFVWPFTQDLFLFPLFQQNFVWQNDRAMNFQTKEGLSVSGDFGVTYAIEPDSALRLFQRYRRGVDEITDMFLKSMIRDALNLKASKMSIESVYGEGRQILLDQVNTEIQKNMKQIGINVERVFTIGDFRMPPQVVAAINNKIEAVQRAQQRENEIREAEAEAQKRLAAVRGEAESLNIKAKAEADAVLLKARAEAEANQLRLQQLTPQLIQYEMVKRWSGNLPTVQSSPMPFFNVDKMISGDSNNNR